MSASVIVLRAGDGTGSGSVHSTLVTYLLGELW